MTDRWYVLRGTTKVALICAVLALALFAWHGGDKPEDQILNNAAPQVQDSPTSPPAQMASQEPAAAAPLGCVKLYRGQWLRVEAIHRGDVEKLRIECFYGYGPQWEAM